MDAQVALGYEVFYFFSGRQYPLARGPRLQRWENRGVRMLEVINSPLFDHGRQPAIEISELRIEALLKQTVAELRPDVCHVQELAGLPSSVLEVLRAAGIPTVMTLQDYFPVCSTFKLLDASGEVCLRHSIGEDCMTTTQADPRAPGVLIDASVRSQLEQLPMAGRVRGVGAIAGIAGNLEARRRKRHRSVPSADAFQRRREVNLTRLNGVDILVAMSSRVAEIYEQLGVNASRLRTVTLTLRHIEQLKPRRLTDSTPGPVTFATLAGFESSAKGANLIIGAMRILSSLADEGRFRVLVLGHVDRGIAARAAGLAGLEIRGPYPPQNLDLLLESVDVGLIPSVWEEAYAYAGVEFLAKGIPVIANAIGGMTDYVREGQTGWLNHSRSSEGLARIMSRLIETPAETATMAAQVVGNRGSIIKSHAQHVAEMEAVYGDAISLARGDRARPGV